MIRHHGKDMIYGDQGEDGWIGYVCADGDCDVIILSHFDARPPTTEAISKLSDPGLMDYYSLPDASKVDYVDAIERLGFEIPNEIKRCCVASLIYADVVNDESDESYVCEVCGDEWKLYVPPAKKLVRVVS